MKTMKKVLTIGMAAAMSASMLVTPVFADGTLTFGCQNYSAGHLDPAVETNTAWNCMRFGVGQCLFRFNDSMEVEPWLADDCEISEDHKTWVIHIREGVKFSDGCDLTPSKVCASFDRLFEAAEGQSSSPWKYLEKEATWTADDEAGTVTIQTVTAYPDLRKNLAYPTMEILDVEHTEDYETQPIGTGPYKEVSFTEEMGHTMEANEYYWDGEVPYDTVEILFMGDASAKAMALQSGQVDLVENITTISDLQTLEADPNYTVTIANGVRCGFSYINRNGVLANDDLRAAVLMGVDNETMCNITVGGLYTYGFSVLPSNLAYNYDQLENPFAYDKDAAIARLDEAGIVDNDGDGIRELDGENVVLDYITYENRCLSVFAEGVQQLLSEIGIGVNVRTMDSDSEWNEMVNGNYDLCSSNWTTVGTGDPTEYLDNWYGKSDANYCGYANDEYDALYEQLKSELDDAKRTEIITQLQQILINDGAALVHGYYNSSMISSPAVEGAQIHTADYYWLTTEMHPAE